MKRKWITMLCAAVIACSMTVNAAPFDAAYYAAQNPDVVAAVGNDAAMLEMHYNSFGAAEGRRANAQDAGTKGGRTDVVGMEDFDASYYAAQNPDVTAVFGDAPLALYTHYVNFGAAEGRAPSAAALWDPYARFAASESSSGHHSGSGRNTDSASGKDAGSASSSGSGSGSGGGSCVHQFTYTSLGADKHEASCTVCGYMETKSHSLTYQKGGNSWEHEVSCAECDYKVTEACTVIRKPLDEKDSDYNSEHKKQCEDGCGWYEVEAHKLPFTVKTVKSATCEEDGEQEKICDTCGYTKKEDIGASGHSWNSADGKCFNCGIEHQHTYYTHGQTGKEVCSGCGYEHP